MINIVLLVFFKKSFLPLGEGTALAVLLCVYRTPIVLMRVVRFLNMSKKDI
jgi:hypothetical protein